MATVLGIENDSWTKIVLFDGLLLLIIAVKQIPFKRVLEHWYATLIAVTLSLFLIGQMGLEGWELAEVLSKPSPTEWQYLFGDGAVTSDNYSFVFEGDSYVVFYERESGEFLLKDAGAVKSFVGKL